MNRDKVVEAAVRMRYCFCGHKAFDHEIAMHTPQTGRCLVAGCDCVSCDTPSREALGDEVERLLAHASHLQERLDEAEKAMVACTRAMRAYAEKYRDTTHVDDGRQVQG